MSILPSQPFLLGSLVPFVRRRTGRLDDRVDVVLDEHSYKKQICIVICIVEFNKMRGEGCRIRMPASAPTYQRLETGLRRELMGAAFFPKSTRVGSGSCCYIIEPLVRLGMST